jgi:taurine dioxygenase
MSEAESRPLLDFLFEHVQRPEFACRFRWAEGSLAVWDNRCTVHYAVNDYDSSRRLMHRTTVAGERPMAA